MANLVKRPVRLTAEMWQKLSIQDCGLGMSFVLREIVGKEFKIPQKERHGCTPKKSTTRK